MSVKKEKTANYGYLILIIVLVLIGLILLNMIAGFLVERHNIRLDLTDEKLYTLSESSKTYLRDLQHNVDIYVLGREAEWRSENDLRRVYDLLRGYTAGSGGRVLSEFLDPGDIKSAADRFQDLLDLAPNDIVIRGPYRNMRIKMTDLYVDTDETTLFDAEEQITAALDYVTRPVVGKAYFLHNHSETNSKATRLKSMLEQAGYTCDPLDLRERGIPADAEVVISVAPRSDFPSEDVEKLQEYMDAGGFFFLFYLREEIEKPLLDAFLSDWGVRVEPALLQSRTGGGLPTDRVSLLPVVPNAEDFPHIASYAENAVPPVLISGYPITLLGQAGRGDGALLTPLLETDSSGYSYKEVAGLGQGTSGIFAGAVLSLRQYDSDTTARLVVTSYSLAEDGLGMSNETAEQNGGFIMTVIQEFVPVDLPEVIPSKPISRPALQINSTQANVIIAVFVIVLPLFFLLPLLRVSLRKKR